jgi:hypothetical protein
MTNVAAGEPVKHYMDTERDHQDLNAALSIPPSCEIPDRHTFGWRQENLAAGIPRVPPGDGATGA